MYYEIVLAGVAISLLFVELTGLSPAGLIVPGYLALCLQTPWRIVYTLAVAVAAWGIAKLLGNVMILYGRRRFAVMVLLSFAIDLAVTSLGLLAYDPGMIGVLVPGIMAQELERQGFLKSLVPLAAVVGILALIMMWQGTAHLRGRLLLSQMPNNLPPVPLKKQLLPMRWCKNVLLAHQAPSLPVFGLIPVVYIRYYLSKTDILSSHHAATE